jgi:hypothetical protein
LGFGWSGKKSKTPGVLTNSDAPHAGNWRA